MQIIFTLLLVAFAYGELPPAPYPPSGYKPEGEPFTLPPTRFTQNQNTGYQQPQTQYGAPSAPQTQYGVPEPQTAYGAPNREYLPPNQPEDNQRATDANAQNNGFQYSDRGDIPYPQSQNSQNQFQQNFNYDRLQTLQARRNQNQRQFSRFPSQSEENKKANQAFGNDDGEIGTGYGAPAQGNQGIPAQSYGPPSSTQRPFVRTRKPSRNPESTTTPTRQQATPAAVTPLDTEEVEEDRTEPNVSIATAFAGRYYVLQPNGQLQRVEYKATQSNDDANENGFTANLVFRNVDPIREPIFLYNNAPLIKLNK